MTSSNFISTAAADYNPTNTPAWKTLEQQAEKAQQQNISDFFQQNPQRS